MAPKKKLKSYTIRIYIGYGEAGAQKYASILQEAHRKQVKVSKLILDILKKTYPQLSI